MLQKFFQKSKIVGMIHVPPLPGSPRFGGSIQKIIDVACNEAEIYAKHDVGGVLIENMHDIPYVKGNLLGPETVATMTRVCTAVRQIIPSSVPCGIQVLAAGNEQALAVAQASSCNFIRVEGYVFGHVADEGYIDSCAGSLLRYRSKIRADDIRVFTDIKKKHSSHAITQDVSIEDVAEAAEFFHSNGVIITGTATGKEADTEQLKSVKIHIKIPVIIGSGVTLENMHKYLLADAFIIGSFFKVDGRWWNALDEDRLSLFIEKYYNLINNLKFT